MIKEINKNFLIRYQIEGRKETALVGAGQYYRILGNKKLANKHFKKALESGKDIPHYTVEKSS